MERALNGEVINIDIVLWDSAKREKKNEFLLAVGLLIDQDNVVAAVVTIKTSANTNN
jgi:hypothetical protein